jgi:hypothetical protein
MPVRPSPIAATTTKLHITSSGEENHKGDNGISEQSVADKTLHSTSPYEDKSCDESKAPSDTPGNLAGSLKEPAIAAGGWFRWLGRPSLVAPGIKKDDSVISIGTPPTPSAGEHTQTIGSSAEEGITEMRKPEDPSVAKGLNDESQGKIPTGPQVNSSWFGIWPSGVPQAQTQVENEQNANASESTAPNGEDKMTVPRDIPMNDAQTDSALSSAKGTPLKPAGWAFWSKDKGSAVGSTVSVAESNVGELAVANTSSQSNPEAAKAKEAISKAQGSKATKRERPKSLENVEPPSQEVDSPAQATPTAHNKSDAASSAAKKQLQKSMPPNLVLPSFEGTYRLLEAPGIMEQIARMLHLSKQPATKHVSIAKEPHKVKKAIAIGVHGYFPAPLIRTVIGQPTGTSVKFANQAASSIRRWTQKHGYDCDIEKVALEGEGRIADRVETLWKLMLNWIDHIQKADFILIACHSQGVPVSMMLVAKLIEFGCVEKARIGICAMAGINLGPFADYRSRLFGATAAELFEFSNPRSSVADRYEEALKTAIGSGVRICFVGSIDDQLVSLEVSSPFINHKVISMLTTT